ncbi:TPA: hypothetical protein QDZ66_002065 [Pluralibacter gergoviae]|uniref:hypothetical protein n=1 Tax=Pluralibacter gergoviae TaxID=61647 RepID=UPI0006ABF7C6|nr:hypothetical protein [Pluralibacter gergoviae]HDS1151312.1 hypothetical protein [Pluralibacter gergoviae]
MSTIIVKDALRASVEAASNGARTVLYTATGQPTFMNIIPKQTWNQLLPSLSSNIAAAGLSGKTHPAFIFGDKEADQIYIGTYPSTLVNNEFLSLPYEMATNIGMNVASSGRPQYNPATMLSVVYGQGSGFHPLSYPEQALIFAIASKNEQRAAVSGMNTPNGANGSKSNLNLEYNSLYGAIGAWQVAFGMRIVGDANNLNTGAEFQFYRGMNNSIALLTNPQELTSTFEGSENWVAMDATTGEFIPATYTGSLANSDYIPTTKNSVRLFTSKAASAPAIPANGVWIRSFETNWNYDPTPFTTTINGAVVNKLRLLFALPNNMMRSTRGGQINTEPTGTWRANVAYVINTGAYRWGDWMAMPYYEWAYAGASMRTAYVNPASLK